MILGDYTLTVTSGVDGKVVNSTTVDGVTTYVLADAHVHSYDTVKYDDTNHWNECSCGAKSDETAHTFTDTVTDPTCTAGGYTSHVCECGYSHTDTATAALGHNGVGTEAVAASYATVGTAEYYTCDRCHEHFADSACDNAISDLEAWKTADGLIAAQKDDAEAGNSAKNPYLIANAADYKEFGDKVNAGTKMSGKYARLTANIGNAEDPIKTRIGNSGTNYFAGTLDGNGKTVYVTLTATNGVGVVGYSGGATVLNLTVQGAITCSGSGMGAGGIVGTPVYASGAVTTVKNCVNEATVKNTHATNGNAGGIVGRSTANLLIENCVNKGEVSTTANYAGGILGYSYKASAAPSVTIKNCRNEGAISGKTGIGGIVGILLGTTGAEAQTVEGVTNTGTVTGTDQVGGIIGTIGSGAFTSITITYYEAGLSDDSGDDKVVGKDSNSNGNTAITKLDAPEGTLAA